MKKTFVTTMPDHVGAFLKASQCFAALEANITRVSYNKAVDTHTLFIEAEGTPEALEDATEHLAAIGYLPSSRAAGTVLLMEFKLRDVPGAVTPVLRLIQQFAFNISYISSQEDGSGYQQFKMGLFVEDPGSVSRFLEEASRLCAVRVIDYDKIERTFDNSVFYISFANELAARMGLGETERNELVIQSNLVMQLLDEHGGSPHKTFDFVGKFGESLARYKGDYFAPRLTCLALTPEVKLTLVEPPCGSNTAVLRHGDRLLFIDTGYACYREEMLDYLYAMIPDFDACRREAVVTHADVDHCGLLDLFDTVWTSRKSIRSFQSERAGTGGLRERNPLHAPYIRICKLLTGYTPPRPETLRVIAGTDETVQAPLERTGTFSFGPLRFEVWEGAGGHLPGEIVLLERAHRIAFTGDIYINLKETTREQAAYNRYAPYLMTSVDTDPALAAQERQFLFSLLTPGDWTLLGGHGPHKTVSIPAPDAP